MIHAGKIIIEIWLRQFETAEKHLKIVIASKAKQSRFFISQ